MLLEHTSFRGHLLLLLFKIWLSYENYVSMKWFPKEYKNPFKSDQNGLKFKKLIMQSKEVILIRIDDFDNFIKAC